MEDSKNDFHISFFKPTTAQAKSNRNIVIWFVCIWAIAIFGFQIALFVLQKPTPEPALIKFENVWPQVKSNNATKAELQDFSYSALSVLGKVFIKPQYKAALDNALSWAVYQLADSVKQIEVLAEIRNFETSASEISDIHNEEYQKSKIRLSQLVSPLIGLEANDVRTTIVPLELVSSSVYMLSEEDIKLIEEAMPIYLIHNQSFLTDTKFMGFPFHYFYTAVFLLVLFVGLCWLYCIRIDQINAKLKIAD